MQLPDVQRCFLALVMIGIAGVLQGCEQPWETALRLSCRWNTDIVLKHCDRWSFARCIEHCEFCVYGSGDQKGHSDECAQMKCAAYCAKQEDDPKCVLNYEELCIPGKETFEKATQTSCDVDCSSAGKVQASFMLSCVLACLSLHLSGVPPRMLALCFLVLVASTLQGCGTCWSGRDTYVTCVDCPPGVPSLPEFEPDLDQLDYEAGCKNEWDPIWGNPCASDVPVLFAKKGYYPDADYKYIKEQVENEKYECLKHNGKMCEQWSTYEESCHEIDFGICNCNVAADNGEFCQEWTCIAKEAEQNLCWESCCGSDSCDPCIHCGQHGTSPFPMDREIYEKLLSQDGIAFANTAGLDSDDLAKLRTNYWGSITFNHPYTGQTDCVASRDVHSIYEIQCSVWREIETEISFCRCLQPDSKKEYCHEWSCEEKDVGQFSILFAQPQSYAAHIEGQEVESYTCTKVLTSTDGTKTCGQWTGHISSWEEVEVAVCKGCEDLDTAHCSKWECNEYEMKAIWPSDIVWGRRLGMAVVHFLWIIPSVMIGMFVCFYGCVAGSGGDPDADKSLDIRDCVAATFSTAFVMFIITCMGFWRYLGDEGRSWTPWQPYVGFLVTMFAFYVVLFPIFCCMKTSPGLLILATATLSLVFVGFAWECGLVVIGPLIGAPCCCIMVVMCGEFYKHRGKDEPLFSEDSELEEWTEDVY